MIVLDIETSGLHPERNGIWQIGAIDFNNPEESFLEEARIDEEDFVDEDALKIIGKTENELRDKDKQSQNSLLLSFFRWMEKREAKNFVCQNPQFDVSFIDFKARKYGLQKPFHFRSFDLHSIASLKYFQINKKLLISEGYSRMNLSEILKFCGMQDNRQAHNALEDAKLTAECLSRILNGKNLLSEYQEFKIPEYLNS